MQYYNSINKCLANLLKPNPSSILIENVHIKCIIEKPLIS